MIPKMLSFFHFLPQDGEGDFFFPAQASNLAKFNDWLFYYILIVSAVFFFAIMLSAGYFSWKYHKSRCPEPQPSPSHSNTIEFVWSVIPTIFLAYMFWQGFVGFMNRQNPPADAYQVHAQGQKWNWIFQYPDGTESNVLHLPLNRPIEVSLGSNDVLHSLFIPAFRTKMDAVPGRLTSLWFTPTMIGEFEIFCAEYCGTEHSSMITTCKVETQAEFDAWLEEAGDFISKLPPVEAGKRVFAMKGCAACHTVDGAVGIGPTFKGSFGTERKLTDGSKVTMDYDYVYESLMDPQAKLREGFPPVMPTFQGQMDDEKIRVLVEYLKTL